MGDVASAVAENRRVVAEQLGLVTPDRWQWLRQVHGPEVVRVERVEPPPAADAAVTATRGLPLVVITADCAPIALAAGDAAAVVHAGWRGLQAGIVERAVAELRALPAARGAPVRAVIGPCISVRHYEFGRADLDRLVRHWGPGVEGTTLDGRPAFDLPAGVRAALAATGVGDDAVEDLGICTYASAGHYSHRREAPTGRQALIVVLEP